MLQNPVVWHFVISTFPLCVHVFRHIPKTTTSKVKSKEAFYAISQHSLLQLNHSNLTPL